MKATSAKDIGDRNRKTKGPATLQLPPPQGRNEGRKRVRRKLNRMQKWLLSLSGFVVLAVRVIRLIEALVKLCK